MAEVPEKRVSSMTHEQQVTHVVNAVEACKKHHDYFVRRYERLERAYRGILVPRSGAAKWRNVITPPYAYQLIETVVANTVEENLRLTAIPAPKPGLDLQAIMDSLEHAEAAQDLVRSEHRIDGMDAKQRTLFLSDAICGMGIGTNRWAYSKGPVQKQVVVEEPVHHPDTGEQIGSVPRLEMQEADEIIRDHSTFEVIDPRDFMMHESTKVLDPRRPGGAQYIIHRCWYSIEQLRSYERGGYMSNVEKLVESQDLQDEYSDRETALWNVSRTKDLIEVLEMWEYREGRILRTIVGNRKVLLSPMQVSPFTHGNYPFVIANSMPQMFSLRGMSTVELVEKLQEMLWTLQSQRLDNIELINNAIILIRADIDDTEAFEWYPGAKWPVQSPHDVESFAPPYQLATLTLEAENVLKGDLQTVTSAAPMAGGASSQVDQQTATGVSIIMSNAQKALQARKTQAMFSLVQEAEFRLKNCQQFISDKRLLHILGESGVPMFREVDMVDVQGEFAFEWRTGSESMMRQERRSEAMQWLQVIGQMAPLMAASQQPLDLKELILWAAKRWDIDDAARFFSQAPPPPAMAGAPGGGGGGTPPPADGSVPPGEPNMGVTSSTAVDATSPSATGGLSMAPSQFAARALSMNGGVANT